jgi:hypothetical protein
MSLKGALGGLLAAVLLQPVLPGGVAYASDDDPFCGDNCFHGQAAPGRFDVTGVSDAVDGRDHGHRAQATTWTEVEEDSAPTCMGNSRGNADALCGAAVNSCPAGQIRFWVWHRTVQYTRQSDGTVTSTVIVPWHQEPRTYCLGADDPLAPRIAKVIGQMQTDFATLPLPTYDVRSDPGPTTLVNIETAFFAGSAEPKTFNPVLLGVPVHVTATPVRWFWTWGDGSTSVTTTPGVPKQPAVSHLYKRAGDVVVTVVVEWTGSFTVGNDPTVIAITAAARTPAQTATVKIREARSQLVSH